MSANINELNEIANEALVNKDNILATFDSILSGETKVLFVEGEDGIGKTTLARMYNAKRSGTSILLELDVSCRWGSDIRFFLYMFYTKLHKCLYGQDCDIDSIDIPDGAFLELLINMNKSLSKKKENFAILVDGLDEITQDDAQVIINYLPISDSFSNYKLVITGDPSKLTKYFKCDKAKTYIMSGFTHTEVKEYLSSYVVDDKIVTDISLTSKGNPGYLASIKRMIDSGLSVDEVIKKMPENLPKALLNEWDHANIIDSNIIRILALIAHECRPYSITQLSAIFDVDTDFIKNALALHKFIIIEDDIVTFISDTFKRFVEHKLDTLKNEVYNILIEYLSNNPYSDESLSTLPQIFFHTARYGDLLTYLSHDILYHVVTKASSLKMLRDHISIGLLSAIEVKKPEVIIGYSLKCAAVESMNKDKVWKSEIDALMSLGEHDEAIELAKQTILIEDRLAAYAQICKHLSNNNEPIDKSLLEQLKISFINMDTSTLGDRAIEIAMDISAFDPEMAIDLIKASLKVENDPNSTDFAFTKLSISALFNNKKEDSSETSLAFDKHIANPSLQDLTKGLRILSQKKSVDDLIKSVQDINDTSIQIRFICEWVIANKKMQEAIDVSKYGLDLILRKTDYSPNSKIFYDLITPIEFNDDKDKVLQIIDAIDFQLPNLKIIGPYEDFNRLLILLAIGKVKLDSVDAYERLSNVYYDISSDTNPVTKCNIYARILYALKKVRTMTINEVDEELEYVVKDETTKLVNYIFANVADHYEALKNSLGTICLYDYDLAISLINTMNTKYRQDMASDLVIRTLIMHSGVGAITNEVVDLFKAISDVSVREDLFVYLLDKMHEDKKAVALSTKLAGELNKVTDCTSDVRRCNALCLLACYQNKHNDSSLIPMDALLIAITELWSSIDNTWFKIDMGYTIVGYLATINKDLAIEFLDKTKQEREGCIINSYSLAETNAYAILLAIRAYVGLLEKRIDTEEDLEHLIDRIHQLPSIVTQIRLLTDVSLRAYFANRRDVADKICTGYIQNKSRTIFKNVGLQQAVLYESSPALYMFHSQTALSELEKLPHEIRERAALNIIRCILTKISLLDPVDQTNHSYVKVTYEQLDDVIRLLGLIKRDFKLYDVLSNIADIYVLNEQHTSQYIDRLQKTDIETRLNAIIDKSLPWNDGILHDGFMIVARAQIVRMFKPKDNSSWLKFIAQAHNIPNLADKCYVLSVLYGLMNRKIAEQNDKVLEKIEEFIDQLPTEFEKAEHLLHLAKCISKSDKPKSTSVVKKAMGLIIKDDDNDHRVLRRELIDLAYSLDHDLAASLASMMDDDPARTHVRNDVKRQINVLEMKKELFKHTKDQSQPNRSQEAITEASWKYLASLNANNISACYNTDYVITEISEASKYPLADSYPVFACVIENLVVKYKATEQAKTLIRPLFNYLLSTSDMIMQLTSAVTSKSITNQFIKPRNMNEDRSWMFVQIGDRSKAIKFINHWIEDNCEEYLYVCDQYISVNDLDLLMFIKSVKPHLNVIIITSLSSNPQDDVKSQFLEAWASKRPDDPLPATIYLMDYGDKHESPIHDRWWITQNSGLDVGTSFNSLGNKEAKIRIMESDESVDHLNEIVGYLTRRTILKNGKKIRYDTFVLE